MVEFRPIVLGAIGGAIVCAGAAAVWQIPATRAIFNRPAVRKAGLELVESMLGIDRIAPQGLT